MLEKKIVGGLLICAILGLSACSKEDEVLEQPASQNEVPELITYENGVAIPGQYIVVLKTSQLPQFKKGYTYVEGNKMMQEVAQTLITDHNLGEKPILQTYAHAVKGFVTQLTLDEVNELQQDERVDFVEQDQIIALKNPNRGKPGGDGGGGGEDPQVVPWGIGAVGGSGNGATSGKKAWIIDSGIDLDHADLNVDVANSQSFLGGNQSNNPDDQNGHGTHVAGTVGALDNSIGVVGVAAGVPVVSVRVLDRRGSGSTSGVIAGVNYVAANASTGDVANMSLGGGVSTTLDNAVIAAANSGIKFVLAAGNSSTNANNSSPARVNGSNIYTISAMDINGVFASFSNYGNPPVDYCAPGVNVYSTYKNGGYQALNGTSMAAPHVAGILILGAITSSGTVTGDPDGTADPKAFR